MRARSTVVVTPTGQSLLARARALVLLVGIAVIATALLVLVPDPSHSTTPLSTTNHGEDGAQALVRVLGDHGVSVKEAAEGDIASADADTTVVVIDPEKMPSRAVEAVQAAPNVVFVGTLYSTADALPPYLEGLRVMTPFSSTPVKTVNPGCDSPTAARARTLTSSIYRVTGDADQDAAQQWTLCFTSDGTGFQYAEKESDGRFRAVITDPARLTNSAVLRDGNASLAIGAMGRTRSVLWYMPTGEESATSASDLAPAHLRPLFLLLVAAALVLALARGRRMGRLASEKLPVEVPASEILVGKARLMRTNRAFGHAAQALRSASARRIAQRLGVPASAPAEQLVGALERRGVDPAHSRALLWGPAPASHSGLTVLAEQLDALEKEIRND